MDKKYALNFFMVCLTYCSCDFSISFTLHFFFAFSWHRDAHCRRRCVATKGAPCRGWGLAAVEARHISVTYVGCCGAAGPWGWVRQLETRRRSSVVGRRRRRRHLYRPSRCDRRVRSSLRERIALHVHLLKD